ncbi:hypothetical protein [Actinoplanes sp. NPDC026619]|uniref:hypothetical protein n=1 Tax=Actinoplanes sp. NPDC026619 TaxID=3155798 RepID=UPI0033D00B14
MTRSFLPSRDGFTFVNTWPRQPALTLRTPFGPVGIGNAAGGLCGGMVFAALDYWHAGVELPAERPGADHPLYKFFVRRLIQSWRMPIGILRYYRWMILPDSGATARTLEVQWARIAEDLDRSMPVPLGVVTVASKDPRQLALNHQVLAVGYRQDGSRITIQVYDPNRGPRDDTFIAFDAGAPDRATSFEHNVGIGDRRIRGFFRAGYRPSSVPS